MQQSRTTPPRVTVVVPLYNKAKHIRRCLESIAGQTFDDLEVLVVDDGSVDEGASMAESFPDPRVRTIRQANAGPGASRNRGIREARGIYVAFLDGDDVWLPRFLETSVAVLDGHPEVVSFSGGWIDHPLDPKGERWAARGITEGIQRLSPATPVSLLAVMVPFMTPCTTIARTEILLQSGGFHEHGCRFGEDGMLWMKLLLRHAVYLRPDPVAEVYREGSALSGNYTGPRPVEPFLTDPDVLRSMCPCELRPLLDRFYAFRAMKTACMFGYWGRHREAAALVRQFVTVRDWRMPLLVPALIAATPFGSVGAALWRRMARTTRFELPRNAERPS